MKTIPIWSSTPSHRVECRYPSPKLHSLDALLKIHQLQHSDEPKLPLVWREVDSNQYEKGAWFHDQWIRFTSYHDRQGFFVSHLSGPETHIPESEVAQQHLANTFGDQEELFVVDSAPQAPYCVHRDQFAQAVVWDEVKDLIIAKSNRGITLKMQGSNIVEAAIWLPRFHAEAMNHSSNIPDAIKEIELLFRQSAPSSSASITCQLTDYRRTPTTTLDQVAANALQQALNNRGYSFDLIGR